MQSFCNQPEFIQAFGHPVDILPFEGSRAGRASYRVSGPPVAPVDFCCGHNLWQPMAKAIKDLGATCVIRGEKEADLPRSTAMPGQIVDGVEYALPLWSMSDEEVFALLGQDTPASYRRGFRASLDCMNCTAHLAADPKRLRALEGPYPETFVEVMPVILWLRERTLAHLNTINEVIRG